MDGHILPLSRIGKTGLPIRLARATSFCTHSDFERIFADDQDESVAVIQMILNDFGPGRIIIDAIVYPKAKALLDQIFLQAMNILCVFMAITDEDVSHRPSP